jgi:phage-related protein
MIGRGNCVSRFVQLDWPVGTPLVKNIGVDLWEIRSKLETRNARILFIMHSGTIVLLHGFIKTEKTPSQDIDLAKKRILFCFSA